MRPRAALVVNIYYYVYKFHWSEKLIDFLNSMPRIRIYAWGAA